MRDLIQFLNKKLISYLESLGWAMQLSVEPILLSRHRVLEQYERIAKILADQSYRSDRITKQLETAYDCRLELSPRLGTGFVVEPWRWIVERTFAWLDNARALCRDYDELPENHEGTVYIAMIRLMLRRLGNNRRIRKPKNA